MFAHWNAYAGEGKLLETTWTQGWMELALMDI